MVGRDSKQGQQGGLGISLGCGCAFPASKVASGMGSSPSKFIPQGARGAWEGDLGRAGLRPSRLWVLPASPSLCFREDEEPQEHPEATLCPGIPLGEPLGACPDVGMFVPSTGGVTDLLVTH